MFLLRVHRHTKDTQKRQIVKNIFLNKSLNNVNVDFIVPSNVSPTRLLA